MRTKQLQRSAGGLLLFLTLIVSARAQTKELPSYISPQHQMILQQWLKREPDLRVATDADCGRCADDIANQRRLSGADYHPYYIVGDFNGDGKQDFAIALIEMESEAEGRGVQKFVVAVFNAPFNSRKISPTFFKDNLNLRDGGLFFRRNHPDRLFIGLFSSDDRLTLIPHGQKYIAQ